MYIWYCVGGVGMVVKMQVRSCLAKDYAVAFDYLADDFFRGLRELRFRVDKPIILEHESGEFYLSPLGLTQEVRRAIRASYVGIGESVELICNHSAYAYEGELAAGYVTIAGGHRVGITGRAIVEGGKVRGLRNVSGLSFRIAREAKGCANDVVMEIVKGHEVLHSMVISPPGYGKTTLLRDIVRQLSDGSLKVGLGGVAVGLVDERSEVAGCYLGTPQNDVGLRTDVLDACPKAEGMVMLLRSMSPRVVAVDEVGSEEDAMAIAEAANAGVTVICTAHGRCVDDIWKRPRLKGLKDIFDRYVVLDGIGSYRVVDKEGNVLRCTALKHTKEGT